MKVVAAAAAAAGEEEEELLEQIEIKALAFQLQKLIARYLSIQSERKKSIFSDIIHLTTLLIHT